MTSYGRDPGESGDAFVSRVRAVWQRYIGPFDYYRDYARQSKRGSRIVYPRVLVSGELAETLDLLAEIGLIPPRTPPPPPLPPVPPPPPPPLEPFDYRVVRQERGILRNLRERGIPYDVKQRQKQNAIWIYYEFAKGNPEREPVWNSEEVLVEIMRAAVIMEQIMEQKIYDTPPIVIDQNSQLLLQVIVRFREPDNSARQMVMNMLRPHDPFTITLPPFWIDHIPDIIGMYFGKVGSEAVKAPQSGGYLNVVAFRLRAISRPSGACNASGKDGRTREGDFILINRISKNNNCFFTSARELFPELVPLRRWDMLNWCEAKRKEFGVAPRGAISSIVAIEMLRKHAKGEWRVHSFDLPNGFEESAAGEAHEIRLAEGHWTKVESSPKQKCGNCGKRYYDKHESCAPKAVAFYAAKVKKYGKGVKPPRFVLASKKEQKESYEHMIHFDLETMPDEKKVHQPYSVGYTIGEEYRELVGPTCIRRFIADVEQTAATQPKAKWYLNAYNGSRFDFFPILRELLDQGKRPHFLLQGGAIIVLQWGNIRCFDLLKHCAGDLKTNLKNAGCTVQKGEIDHDEIAKYGSYEAIPREMREKISEYQKADVLGLKELYEKMNHVINEVDHVNLTSFISTSQLTFDCWTKVAAKEHVIQLPTLEQEPAFRAAVIGARCYKTRHGYVSKEYEGYMDGRIKYEDVKDFQCFIDVVSLYPASMAHNPYPVGKCLRADEDILAGVGEGSVPMGIYLIDYIANKKLLHAPCGYKDPKTKALHWDSTDQKGVWRTSVDIENMQKRGYKITARDGYYWEGSGYIFKEYIEELYKAKAVAEKDSPKYTVAKLKMNGLYGKMIQRPIMEKSEIVGSNADYWKFWGKNQITDLIELGQDWVVSGIPREDEDKERCVTKPTHLGAFILAYSRRIMLDYMDEANPEERIEDDWLYMDTDSMLLPSRCAAKIGRYNGHQLGDIDDDLGEGAKVIKASLVAPKLYEFWYIVPPGTKVKGRVVKEGEVLRKFAGKGLDKKDLTPEKFQAMASGGTVSTTRQFSMKKVGLHQRGELERSVPQFSVVMLRKGFSEEETHRLTRVANRKPWDGRVFNESGQSLPIGSEGP